MNKIGEAEEIVRHVHTKRCGHAIGEDEDYVTAAIAAGAKEIIFTDHAPFPGNPFGNRMAVEDLDGYLDSLSKLRDKYQERIRISAGLEIEYLPSFKNWYEELRSRGILLYLGQHFAEVQPGVYSFTLDKNEWRKCEAEVITATEIEALGTGFFQCVVHPDYSAFRRHPGWDEESAALTKDLLHKAAEMEVPIERNIGTMIKGKYRCEFWNLADPDIVPGLSVVTGVDAHDPEEIKLWDYRRKLHNSLTNLEYSKTRQDIIKSQLGKELFKTLKTKTSITRETCDAIAVEIYKFADVIWKDKQPNAATLIRIAAAEVLWLNPNE